MVVPWPGNDVHSNMQIAWLNEVMRKDNSTLNHALNGHRLGAGEMYVPFNLISTTDSSSKLSKLMVSTEHKWIDKTTGEEKTANIHMCDLYASAQQKIMEIF